jgi:hypothetical protein
MTGFDALPEWMNYGPAGRKPWRDPPPCPPAGGREEGALFAGRALHPLRPISPTGSTATASLTCGRNNPMLS